MTDCPHGDDPAICPPCQGAALPRTVTTREWSAAFPARYEGDCRGCGFVINVGDPIRASDGEYRHADCIDSNATSEGAHA